MFIFNQYNRKTHSIAHFNIYIYIFKNVVHASNVEDNIHHIPELKRMMIIFI